MTTPYRGRAMIGDCYADVDIGNVDVAGWTGTATNLQESATGFAEAVVKLLEQPRPGWSAHATATVSRDGALSLQGTSHFNPARRASPQERSLWVRKSPRAT
jgi:hypothetical protein